jgi:hypothetical protein
MITNKEGTRVALEVAKQIAPQLAGRHPMVQGAILAELTATFFKGLHPDMREEQIALWMRTVRELMLVGDIWRN